MATSSLMLSLGAGVGLIRRPGGDGSWHPRSPARVVAGLVVLLGAGNEISSVWAFVGLSVGRVGQWHQWGCGAAV